MSADRHSQEWAAAVDILAADYAHAVIDMALDRMAVWESYPEIGEHAAEDIAAYLEVWPRTPLAYEVERAKQVLAADEEAS